MTWWDRTPDDKDDEQPPQPRESVYEQRGIADADDSDRWVTVAEGDRASGPLHWVPGWERRARGWILLDEFLRNRRSDR